MTAILKLWRCIKYPTLSIDAYLLEEQSCCIHLKHQSLGLL